MTIKKDPFLNMIKALLLINVPDALIPLTDNYDP